MKKTHDLEDRAVKGPVYPLELLRAIEVSSSRRRKYSRSHGGRENICVCSKLL